MGGVHRKEAKKRRKALYRRGRRDRGESRRSEKLCSPTPRTSASSASSASSALKSSSLASRQQRLDDFAMHIRQSEVAALMMRGQFFVIKSEQMQNRCLQVVHVH